MDDHWIYSAWLCFGLSLAEPEPSNFPYRYAPYQVQYRRNLLFQRGGPMQQHFLFRIPPNINDKVTTFTKET